MEAHKNMQRFADAVYGACEAAVKAKLCPEQPVPSVSDMMIDNASATKAALRGSLVRYPKAAGGFDYRVVPFLDDVLSAGATPKLQLIDRWGGAAKATKRDGRAHDRRLAGHVGGRCQGGRAGREARSSRRCAAAGRSPRPSAERARGRATRRGANERLDESQRHGWAHVVRSALAV